MNEPLVSIIIPTYNRETFINISLDSVVSQTYMNWECIVVDDGSKDGTFEVLKGYQKKDSRINFLKRDRFPKGAPTCRNIGLEHAKGDYVIFLDSDDYLLPFCLDQRLAAFKKNTDCNFLVFPMGELKNNEVFKIDIPNSDDYLINFLSAVLPWSIMCPIWKASFLRQLKGFTEGYPRFNDPELMIRALLQPQVKFNVFKNAKYDSVYIPSPKSKSIFNDSVFKSLFLLIPDVVQQLEYYNKASLKNKLVFYLHLWFKYFYIPLGKNNMKPSLQLINMFKGLGIISKSKSNSLKLRLFLHYMSKFLFKRPLDKLSDKALYY